MSKLNALSAIVHPREIHIESRLQHPKDDRNRVWLAVCDIKFPPYPVQYVKGAVGAEREQVVGVYYCWDGGLAEEEELREDAGGFEDYGEGPHDLHPPPIPRLLKNHHHQRRSHSTTHQTRSPQLPRLLALPRPRIHSQHQEQNVHAAQDVEYLEDGVPGRVELEDVEVAGHEDAAVEGLRDEGDAFGALVAVDGEDEDAFREGVRDVAEDAEDVHRHHDCDLVGCDAWSRRKSNGLEL